MGALVSLWPLLCLWTKFLPVLPALALPASSLDLPAGRPWSAVRAGLPVAVCLVGPPFEPALLVSQVVRQNPILRPCELPAFRAASSGLGGTALSVVAAGVLLLPAFLAASGAPLLLVG